MSHLPALTDPEDLKIVTLKTCYGGDVATVVLRGEADFSTLDELDAGLKQVQLDAKMVHIDVTGVQFADTAAIRRLALFARQVRQSGCAIATHGANRTLRTVVDQLGVGDDLGLV